MTPQEAEALWKAVEENEKFKHDFLIRRGWTPFEEFEDKSGVSKWKHPKGEIVCCGDAYDRMTSDYLDEKGWKDIIEVERYGNAEWKKPIEQWCRSQSPVTKRIYTYLDAQHIMEKNWDEFVECCEHSKMLNDLIGPNFEGSHIKTWFYLTFNENHEKIDEVFCHWTMQPYMIEAGLEILKKYDPNVQLHHDNNKHWTDIPFVGISEEDREKIYKSAWHEVNEKWGYLDD